MSDCSNQASYARVTGTGKFGLGPVRGHQVAELFKTDVLEWVIGGSIGHIDVVVGHLGEVRVVDEFVSRGRKMIAGGTQSLWQDVRGSGTHVTTSTETAA